MKEKGMKEKIFYSFSSDIEFIHVAVYYKGYYIDAVGIHTEDEFCQNHLILYDVDPNDVGLSEFKPNEINSIRVFLNKSEMPSDMKYYEKYAKHIASHPEFDFFIKNRKPKSKFDSPIISP